MSRDMRTRRPSSSASSARGDQVVLTVRDDGRGLPPAARKSSHGIRGMRERATADRRRLHDQGRAGAGHRGEALDPARRRLTMTTPAPLGRSRTAGAVRTPSQRRRPATHSKHDPTRPTRRPSRRSRRPAARHRAGARHRHRGRGADRAGVGAATRRHTCRRSRRRPRCRPLRRALAVPAHQGPAAPAGSDHLLGVRQADAGAARASRARRRRRGQGGAGGVVARGDPFGRARGDRAAPFPGPRTTPRRLGWTARTCRSSRCCWTERRCPPSPTRCGRRPTRSRGGRSASSAACGPAPPAGPTSGSWSPPAVACPSCPFADYRATATRRRTASMRESSSR